MGLLIRSYAYLVSFVISYMSEAYLRKSHLSKLKQKLVKFIALYCWGLQNHISALLETKPPSGDKNATLSSRQILYAQNGIPQFAMYIRISCNVDMRSSFTILFVKKDFLEYFSAQNFTTFLTYN